MNADMAPDYEAKNQRLVEDKLQSLIDWTEAALEQRVLLSRLTEHVEIILGAQKALFFLAEPAPPGFQLRAPRGELFFRVDAEDAFCKLLANAGLQRLDELPADSSIRREFVEKQGFRWALVLGEEDHPRGLMIFDNLGVKPLSAEVREGLRRLGEVGARVVDRMRLLERERAETLENKMLLEVVKQMSATLDLSDVLSTIIDALQVVVPYDQAVIFLLDRGSGEITNLVHRGYSEAVVDRLRLKIGEGVSGWVAKTGQPVLIPDVARDRRYINIHPSTKSEIAVPLIRAGVVIGVFNLESDQIAAFDSRHLDLLQAFASQAAIAIEQSWLHEMASQKHALERELRFARDIQTALLPKKMPRAKRISLSALNIPSRHVSGDFYDAMKFADGRIGITIADVSGKGTPGAIMMASLFGTYRSEVRRGLPAHKLIGRLNRRSVEQLMEGGFASIFYSLLDPETLALEYCNAGHNPPILLHADGDVDLLDTGGLLLGISPRAKYERGSLRLASGDLFCLYTDGVTEAESPEEELFGVNRLIQVLRKAQLLTVSEIKEKILKAVTAFTAGSSFEDDVTVVVVKVK